jgi:hypothetical protein
MISGLERAGRDWKRIDRCLWEWERELGRIAGLDSWSAEYGEFLTDRYVQVLAQLIEQAVELEEYEWAEACQQRLRRFSPTVE